MYIITEEMATAQMTSMMKCVNVFWCIFSGYLYAHISYLEDNSPACLMLLSTDRNAFFELADSRAKILEVSSVVIP